MAQETISHYKIIKKLGSGGMAEVYEALDLQSKEHVALKILLPQQAADPNVRRRFLREAQVGMQFDHPGVARVFEVAEENDRPFLAMELVKGPSLDVIIKDKRLDIERCIDIGIQVAEVMSFAHEKKTIHRDLKPSNIMVAGSTIKVMDFGLAKIVDTSSLTQKHEILGTISYMAPEQAIGAHIDERCDIFSFGVVLYEMLAGARPFQADNPGALIHAILYSDPLRMSELGIEVPVELEQVVFKAISKKPQLRYQTAQALADDLRRVKEVMKGASVQLTATEEVFEEQVRGIYSPLTGREEEMTILETALERMLKGEGSIILVSGEAGIGKSRLVWEFGRSAKQKGARYLVASCVAETRNQPYKPIIEIIRSYLVMKGIREPGQIDSLLEQKAPQLLARSAIIQSILYSGPKEKATLINKEQIWDTLSALIKLMSQDRPVVLHIEDFHWVDASTLNFLKYLIQGINLERIMIINTFRTEELGMHAGIDQDTIQGLRDTIAKKGLGQELVIKRLDKNVTQRLVNSVFTHAEFPASLYESVFGETEGNPLFVLEVLKLLRDEGLIEQKDTGWKLKSLVISIAIPNRIKDIVERRLKKLGEYEKKVLDVAAIAGFTFQSDAVCAVLGLPRMNVLQHLQKLESTHQIIHALEQGYRFDHIKIQEVIYNGIIPELRKEYHRAIAEHTIEQSGGMDSQAGNIAHHLVNAGLENESLKYLLRAGEHARRLHASEEAMIQLNTGIGIVDKLLAQHDTADLKLIKWRLHGTRGWTNEFSGSFAEAQSDYECALALANEMKDDKCRAWALFSLGIVSTNRCDYDKALSQLNEALEIFILLGDQMGEFNALNSAGLVYQHCGNYEKASQATERALAIARDRKDMADEATALANLASIAQLKGDYSRALAQATEARRIRKERGDSYSEAMLINNVGIIYREKGDLHKALLYHEQALDTFERLGALPYEANVLDDIALTNFRLGNIDKAISCREQTISLCAQVGNKELLGESLGHIAHIYGRCGETKKAFKYFKQAQKVARQIKNIKVDANLHSQIGDTYRAHGDYANALKNYERALDMVKKTDSPNHQWECLHGLFRIHVILGNYDTAYGYLDEAMKIPVSKLSKECAVNRQIDVGLAKFHKNKATNVPTEIANGLKEAVHDNENELVIETCLLMADLQLRTRHYKKAQEYAERALKPAREQRRNPDIAKGMIILAKVHYNQKQFAATESCAREALEIAKRCNLSEATWRTNRMLGKIHMRMRGKEKDAKREYLEAKKALESVTSKLDSKLRKTFLNTNEIREFHKELKKVFLTEKRNKKKKRNR